MVDLIMHGTKPEGTPLIMWSGCVAHLVLVGEPRPVPIVIRSAAALGVGLRRRPAIERRLHAYGPGTGIVSPRRVNTAGTSRRNTRCVGFR